MNVEFSGKTVVVTGAAHGMGRAMAVAFARRGARVWGCDVLAEELEVTRRQCLDAGAQCDVHAFDVRDRDLIRRFCNQVGQADILINNAGGVLGQVGRPMEEVTDQEWDDLIAVNLSAAFRFARGFVPGMKRAGFGRIINISSGAGLNISLTGIQAYATAKAGLIHLTRQLAHELGPSGITVNSIAPGFVRSNPNTEKQWQSYGEDGQRRLIESIAMRRLGSVEDIVYGALFLASEFAGWITGQALSIDGGR